jgi:hypothetical protein
VRRLGVVAPAQLRKVRRHVVVWIECENALGERERHLIARERAVRWEQRSAVLVALAYDHRRVRPTVQQLLELGLDEGALLLDHDDLLEAAGECEHALALERPDEAELEHAQPEALGQLPIDAEVGERLTEIQIRLAGGDDAEARIRAFEHQPVEGVRSGERAHRLQLEAVQPLLLGKGGVRPTDVQAARRQLEVVGHPNGGARGIQLDRGRGIDRVVHALQADPAAAVAGQREAEQTILQKLGDASGVHDRNHGVEEREFALVRRG